MTKAQEKLFRDAALLILDVDGVLTKGEIIYDDRGRELKMFNVKDGLGVFLLGELGIPTVLLSAKNSTVLRRRARDMRVKEVIGGIVPKELMLPYFLEKYRVGRNQICFVGDDLIDVGLMKQVGLGIAVSDAPAIVRSHARYVTHARGGEGAVREVVDHIIKIQKLEAKMQVVLKTLQKGSIRTKSIK